MESNVIVVEPGDTLDEIIDIARLREVRAVEAGKFCVEFLGHKADYYTKTGIKNGLERLD